MVYQSPYMTVQKVSCRKCDSLDSNLEEINVSDVDGRFIAHSRKPSSNSSKYRIVIKQ